MSRKRNIDEHVVEMRFNNEEFERKSKTTLATLDSLKEKLRFNGAEKGIDKLSKSMDECSKNANFSGVIRGLDEVSVKFSALQTISDTVWRSITNTAIKSARKISSSLNAPISQIVEGGKKRAQNIEQAKFQLAGLNITWSEIKDDLDYGVQDTAYGLDSAAKAASQLVASQVKVGKDMKTALRGISGVAAQTNSEYDEIAQIYTTIAGNGRLMGQQLTQLSTKGFNAAATIGKYLGKTEAEVRKMVSDGEISFATFSKAMDDAFGEHAKDANKTFSGALSNTKAALSRIGADVATTGFESLRQILVNTIPVLKSFKKQVSPIEKVLDKRVKEIVSVTVNGLKRVDKMINSSKFGVFINNTASFLSSALDKVHISFKKFVDLGGVENILAGFINIFKSIQQRTNAVKMAFQNVFPKRFVDGTKTLSERFKDFTRKTWLTVEAQEGLRKVMETLFHPFKTISGWIEKFTGYSFDFVLAIHNMIDSVLSFIGMPQLNRENPLNKIFNNSIVKRIGGYIPNAIKNLTTKTSELFDKLKQIWDKVRELPQFQELVADLKEVGLAAIGLIVDGFKKIESFNLADKINVDGVVDAIGAGVSGIVNFKKHIVDFFESFKSGDAKILNISTAFKQANENAGNFVQTVSSFTKQSGFSGKVNEIGQSVSGVGSFLANGFTNLAGFISQLSAGQIILTSFGVGLDILIFRMADFAKVAKGTVSSIGDAFKSFTSITKGLGKALTSFATYNTMKAITIGIIGIAAALVALALVPQENLKNAGIILGGFAAGMALLMAIFSKFASQEKELYVAASVFGDVMRKIGEGVALLGIAVALIGTLKLGDLVKGFVGVLGLVAVMSAAAIALAKYAPKFSKGSAMMLLFAVSIGMLVGSVLALAMFSGPKLDAAMNQIIILFAGMTALSAVVGKFGNGLEGAGNTIALAASLYVLAITLEKLTTIDWNTIKENGLMITAALVTFIGLSVLSAKLGNDGLKGGAGLLAMASSLYVLAQTLIVLGTMETSTISKAIAMLTVLIVAVALLTTISVRTGSSNANINTFASLISIAATMYILAKSLQVLGDMGVDKLETAIKAMGLMFGGLLALLVTMAVISKNLDKVDWKLLAGIGVIIAAVAVSLGVLASVGDTDSLLTAGTTLLLALVGMAALLVAISKLKFDGKKILSLAGLMLSVSVMMGVIGYSLVSLASLPIEQVVTAAISLAGCLIVLVGAASLLDKIKADAFIKLVVAAGAIVIISSALMIAAVAFTAFSAVNWGSVAIALGILAGIVVLAAIFGESILAPLVEAGVALIVLGLGLLAMVSPVLLLAASVDLLGSGVIKLEATFERFILFLPTCAASIVEFLKTLRDNAEEVGRIAYEIGANLVKGLIEGVGEWAGTLFALPAYLANGFINTIKNAFGIHSPSTVMKGIGGYIIEGLIQGISLKEKLSRLKESILSVGQKIIDWFKSKLEIHSPSKVMEAIGGYCISGLAEGLSKDNGVSSALNGVGDDIVTGLDDMDLTAGVTPVLDMDNFDTSALTDSDLTSVLNGSGDYNIATSTAMDNQEMTKYFQESNRLKSIMYTEIQGMRRDMNTLGTKVNNLKVYIDKNALVGQIAPAMNQKLGNTYSRNARATGATRAAIKKRYG